MYGTLSYFRLYITHLARKAACMSVLLHEGVDLKWTVKHILTMNVTLKEMRSHEGLLIPRLFVPFMLSVNINHNDYEGDLC